MSIELKRTFVYNPPSILSLNWHFEFHCTFRIYETQLVVIDIKEKTIGYARLKTKNPGETWKVFLFAWQQCYKLALNYVVTTNKKDALNRMLLMETGVNESG